jgi:hypothetical protein
MIPRHPVPIIVAVLCCLLLEAHENQAQTPSSDVARHATPVDLQAGQSYRAGVRVRVPNGTASFPIPTGWRGERLDEMAAVLLVSEKEAGFVLAFAILNQTENELIALLGEPQPITDTLVFEPAGTVTRQGTNLTANYTAGSLAGRGLAVMGPDQQGVLFLHGRPQKDPRTSRTLLDELAELVRFTPTSDNSPAP